jgi:hypothetical protein
MKLGELSKSYYNAAQARKVLGLDEDAFQYWGRTERIRRVYLAGRKQPVYSRSEIDRMATQISATILSEYPESTTVFKKATVDNMEQEGKLARLIFGEKAEAVEERKAFLLKNPDVDYHLYDQDILVAYINVVPLKHDAIESFMQRKIMAWKISINDIEQFEPGKPLEVLIIDMVTTPIVPPKRRSAYASRLLTEVVGVLTEMGKQGVEVSKAYAASDTTDGIRILKHAGFQVTHEVDKGRLAFELDVIHSDAKILREYQNAIHEWKNKQTNNNQPSSKVKKRTVEI